MNQDNTPKAITPDMTVLDVIAKNRPTEQVFRKYDRQAGICICCDALFDRLDDLSEKYEIDLKGLLNDLEEAGET